MGDHKALRISSKKLLTGNDRYLIANTNRIKVALFLQFLYSVQHQGQQIKTLFTLYFILTVSKIGTCTWSGFSASTQRFERCPVLYTSVSLPRDVLMCPELLLQSFLASNVLWSNTGQPMWSCVLRAVYSALKADQALGLDDAESARMLREVPWALKVRNTAGIGSQHNGAVTKITGRSLCPLMRLVHSILHSCSLAWPPSQSRLTLSCGF